MSTLPGVSVGDARERPQLEPVSKRNLAVAAVLAVAIPSCVPAAVAVTGTVIGGGLITHAVLKTPKNDDCHGTPACGLGAVGELAEPALGAMIVLTSLVTAVALLL
ncbi:MAG TPA: hypothetical protein VGG28_17660 [Kofleriaceae bacterium]|jgi:hypothetical protein